MAHDEPSPLDELLPQEQPDSSTAVVTTATADDDAHAGIEALAWLDPELLEEQPQTPALSRRVTPAFVSLVPEPRKRHAWAWPIATLLVLGVGYVGACALWPLSNLAPTVTTSTVQIDAGAAFALDWPETGSSALVVDGAPGGAIYETNDVTPMASITKTITALMIIQKQQITADDQGPSYTFTWEDQQTYWDYLTQDESALDVPVDGSLTTYQMLEGIMLGSAGNYVDRLVTEIWGTQDAFLADAQTFLADNDLTGITMVDASGISPENTANASDLLALAKLAASDPVLSVITAMPQVELPGIEDPVLNSNPLIIDENDQPTGDEGVIGVKTGSLWSTGTTYYNLLAAKDLTIGDTTIRAYESVLGQPSEDDRRTVSKNLLDELEAGMQPSTAVADGTEVAQVTTEWGTQSTIVTQGDASLITWQGVAPTATTDITADAKSVTGSTVGTMTVTGPFDEAEIPLVLTGDIGTPSLGWRLAHPFQLWGLA
ncbi:MAG: D-alanyl-D-alanine carboxypeptidase [Microbacterium sp.]